jgi:hypothetical protein
LRASQSSGTGSDGKVPRESLSRALVVPHLSPELWQHQALIVRLDYSLK